MTHAGRPKPRPQFDLSRSHKHRHLERLLTLSRPLHFVATHAVKLALTCMIWPRFFAPYRWRLTRYTLPLAHLDPAFTGYKILHLSDFHVGRANVHYLQSAVAKCLAEKPNLVVITGDLIHYRPKSLKLLPPLLQQLAAAKVPDGVLAIFGNHDYHEYSWRHNGKRSAHRSINKRLVRQLQNAGIILLRNDQHIVTRGNARLHIVGLEEMWTDLADPQKAFRNLTSGDPVIALQHNPDGIEFLQPFPWQHLLAGHTHGGQIVLPLLGPPFLPTEHRQYIKGFHPFPTLPGQEPLKNRTMFISTGLGHSYPIRLLCPPEATIFSLKATSI